MRVFVLVFTLLFAELSWAMQIEHCPQEADTVEKCLDLPCAKAMPQLPRWTAKAPALLWIGKQESVTHAGYPSPILDPPIRVISI